MNKEQSSLLEIATLAKSLGFKPETDTTFHTFNKFIGKDSTLFLNDMCYYLLLCEIKLWLLKEHDFLVEISRGSEVKRFNVFIQTYIYEGKDPKNFNSYQEALATGILEGLKMINNENN